VISGPTETVLLPGGKQHLSREERFQYQGGAFPLHPVLQQRAQQLVEQCVAALPRTVGYFSIDLLLCELPEHDCIIEINPRLTTSYIGLRSLCKNNLALAMWNAAQGVAIELDWSHDALMFTADGNVFNPAESG
jgi:predicted ATP-grasp superfamily ATP-dependent carboligase